MSNNIDLINSQNSNSEMPTRHSIILPILIFILSLIVYFSISGLSFFLKDYINPIIINGGAQIIALLIPAFYSVKFFDLNVNFSTQSKVFSIRNIIILISCFILIYILNSAIVGIVFNLISKEKYLEIYNKIEDAYAKVFEMKNLYDYFRSIIFAAFIPAIAEEYIFRGFLLRLLMNDYRSRSGNTESIKKTRLIGSFLIVSSIFAIIHFNPISIIMLFCFSLLLCYLAYKTNSLLPSMILHFLNNFIVITSMYFTSFTNGNSQSMEIDIYIALLMAIFAILSSFHIIKKLRF